MTQPISPDTNQSSARHIARELTEQTGVIHLAVTVPLGCWGGAERAWAVIGPAAANVDPTRFTSELDELDA